MNKPAKRDPEQVIDAVSAAILNGATLRQAQKIVGVDNTVFYEYLNKCPEAAQRYARAMENRADMLVDEALEIADSEGDSGAARNRIEIRKWIAARLNQKRWGDRIDLNVSQTLDIAGTLQAARARLSRPNGDSIEGQCEQVIDLLPVSTPQPLDNQSNVPAVPANPVPDIFD